MSTYSLSYLFCTRNRLSFLKISLEKLINDLREDEEIVVVDGDSNDGTKEYLINLFQQGKIHQYISEPDKNQAHGWNKVMLLARGTIIKKIIDDDVFYYPSIRKCKEFMLTNPQVDVVISNDLFATIYSTKNISKNSCLAGYKKWTDGQIPSFSFSDVHMLIRKSSLAYLGLYNISYVMMDWEYSLRMSFNQANISYFTGYNAMSVGHNDTVTSKQSVQFVNEQRKKAHAFYQYKGEHAQISIWSHIKIFIGKIVYGSYFRKNALVEIPNKEEIYAHFETYIKEINEKEDCIFLTIN